MKELIEKAERAAGALTTAELAALLAVEDTTELFAAAYRKKCEVCGKVVSLRGLIEMSNQCAKNCYYCGIRRGNTAVRRYRLAEDDIVRMARWTFERGYGSLVIQSGEIESEENTALVERVLRRIREFGGDAFGITLSLGEQTPEVYARWRDTGAHRYLLRIETSSPELYARLHPSDHSHTRRVECLRSLKRLGYQTGSGVMIGLPGQTLTDLAHDIEFFRDEDLDMIGMGPWLPAPGTPLAEGVALTPTFAARQLALGLKMIAVTRLFLHDVNIAATTALQTLDPCGRERGVLAGANVMMPNVTDVEYRKDYQLYANKPCLNENSAQCRNCLEHRIQSIGETINWDARGDSRHYRSERIKQPNKNPLHFYRVARETKCTFAWVNAPVGPH